MPAKTSKDVEIVKYKPTVVMTDIDDRPEVGEEVSIKGLVKRVTEHEDGYECTIECQSLEGYETEGLDKAMKKIEKKKTKPKDDE
jgi:hypothetical protein